eukprot:GHVL01025952.1.p2 GENE.GHVL01025952.1~~GHVL01025952.1.p2  ORF type:complete len:314 (-),score=69.09 GHVL01025952.1:1281-2222(-)
MLEKGGNNIKKTLLEPIADIINEWWSDLVKEKFNWANESSLNEASPEIIDFASKAAATESIAGVLLISLITTLASKYTEFCDVCTEYNWAEILLKFVTDSSNPARQSESKKALELFTTFNTESLQILNFVMGCDHVEDSKLSNQELQDNLTNHMKKKFAKEWFTGDRLLDEAENLERMTYEMTEIEDIPKALDVVENNKKIENVETIKKPTETHSSMASFSEMRGGSRHCSTGIEDDEIYFLDPELQSLKIDTQPKRRWRSKQDDSSSNISSERALKCLLTSNSTKVNTIMKQYQWIFPSEVTRHKNTGNDVL